MINKYELNWFDHRYWKTFTEVILAESEDQARSYIDSQTKPEYRTQPYTKPEKDSLRINLIESSITLPWLVESY